MPPRISGYEMEGLVEYPVAQRRQLNEKSPKTVVGGALDGVRKHGGFLLL